MDVAQGPEDFRIITGTYERILYGINANWTKDKTLKLAPIFIVPAHTGLIRTVAVGGQFLASGSTDEIIRLFNIKKRKEYGFLGGHHQGDINDIQFHGKYMFTSSGDHHIGLWRVKDWEYLKTLKGHKGAIHSMSVHPSGKIALSVASDRTVILWNLMTAKKASVNKLQGEGLKVKWNTKGDRYIILFDRRISIFNVSDGKVAKELEQRSKFHDFCCFSLDDKEYIISGHEDKTIRVWDMNTGECVNQVAGHPNRIKALTTLQSQGRDVLVSASSDGTIKCWDCSLLLDKAWTVLGEYNTKSRITCMTTHLGFDDAE
ncbi:WD40 repeat-like protein [Hesseltinella vesiculosa]|uniref:WD40 repeat-like protein n=1 Tax=Hesseltinella vesiculosa TaxID=101127 RepID=A0A1X2GP84_9FUNG|nr:WD40 repeat-like protein [Hesseltinella vesiculosa]